MQVACSKCKTRYKIASEKLEKGPVKVRCKNCGHVFGVRKKPGPEAQEEFERPAAAPSPTPPSGDPPLPEEASDELASGAQDTPDTEEKTGGDDDLSFDLGDLGIGEENRQEAPDELASGAQDTPATEEKAGDEDDLSFDLGDLGIGEENRQEAPSTAEPDSFGATGGDDPFDFGALDLGETSDEPPPPDEAPPEAEDGLGFGDEEQGRDAQNEAEADSGEPPAAEGDDDPFGFGDLDLGAIDDEEMVTAASPEADADALDLGGDGADADAPIGDLGLEEPTPAQEDDFDFDLSGFGDEEPAQPPAPEEGFSDDEDLLIRTADRSAKGGAPEHDPFAPPPPEPPEPDEPSIEELATGIQELDLSAFETPGGADTTMERVDPGELLGAKPPPGASPAPHLDLRKGERRGEEKLATHSLTPKRRLGVFTAFFLSLIIGTAAFVGYNFLIQPDKAFYLFEPKTYEDLWNRLEVKMNLDLAQPVTGAYMKRAKKRGDLYIATGAVTNKSDKLLGAIEVRAAVYDKGGAEVGAATAYCGNVLTEKELQRMDNEDIAAILNKQVGDNFSNLLVDPGQEIPFMVVIAGPPPNIEKVSAQIVSFETMRAGPGAAIPSQ